MSKNNAHFGAGLAMSRRRFVQGLAAGTALAGLAPTALYAAIRRQQLPELRGTVFNLSIGEQAVNITGTPSKATTVNGSLPAPVLHLREGDSVTMNVTNLLPVDSSIHWHGIILPSEMDGVPGVSNNFHGIRPGETFSYRFTVQQSGTYWYHSHSGFQEQTGLYGAIVIDPREPEPFTYDRDYVVQLSDWSDEDPNAIYHKLKKLSHYYNFKERTHADLMRDIEARGIGATWEQRRMWNEMRMSQRDLSDVTGYTYTFLMNGQAPAANWTGLFSRGEKVRLRFINSSAMTFFDVRIPGLKMTVVAADGQYVEPVTVDEFRIGVAETYDVIVEPSDDSAYSIFAQALDRSGYARGTLTPDPSLSAEVPPMDPVPNLTHSDMGMNMAMGGMAMTEMDHNPAMTQGSMPSSAPDMTHTSMAMPAPPQPMDSHSGMNMAPSGQGMSDHGAMAMNKPSQSGTMHSRHIRHPSDFSARPVHHASSEYGPQVDMHAADPQYRLDDPGVGLRNNGRRVLTYADLYNLRATPIPRDPDREIELHLTGNMGRYMWSINGMKSADSEPLRWRLGEQVRITFVNDTMMNHPMHLHGMWSDLETGDNDYLPRKHTVIVQPGSRISYRVNVDAKGSWAYHCHLLYHMLGMFRTVTVS